jgi:hypothetical protein
MKNKKCTVCKKHKPLSCFYNSKTSKDGKGYRCKECDTVARKKWSQDNPERAKESRRGRLLKNRYGITIKDYDALLEKQGGACGICKASSNRHLNNSAFSVDHCHQTGQIRGLLCNQCNRALGMFNDSEELIQKALDWLRKDQ